MNSSTTCFGFFPLHSRCPSAIALAAPGGAFSSGFGFGNWWAITAVWGAFGGRGSWVTTVVSVSEPPPPQAVNVNAVAVAARTTNPALNAPLNLLSLCSTVFLQALADL